MPKRSASRRAARKRARVAVGVAADDDVGRDGRQPGRHLPHVQVVDLDHARPLTPAPAPDLLGVELARRRLHEHAARIAQQAVGGPEHGRCDQQRGDPVSLVKAGCDDQGAGDRGRDESEEVGEDVLEGALDVEAAALGARDQPQRTEVYRDPDQGDDQDQAALDVGRLEQPPHTLDHDQHAEQQQRHPVHLRREDLGALEPVGEAAAGRALGQAQREQGEPDRDRVGEHVRRVREQRQRVGDDAGGHLGRHEREDQRQRRGQPARVRVGRGGVGVRVSGRHPTIMASAAAPRETEPPPGHRFESDARDPGQGGVARADERGIS